METKNEFFSYGLETYEIKSWNRFVTNDLILIPTEEIDTIRETIEYIEANRGKIDMQQAEALLMKLWNSGIKWLQ